jgi:tetratricopeptide (TPR) repeat protein
MQLATARDRYIRLWETSEQPRAERLRVAGERALAWHRREAQHYSRDRHWFGALWHLNRLIDDAHIGDASLYLQRAKVLAESEKWDQALADNTKATELSSLDTFAWYDRACLALQLDKTAIYRQACAEALRATNSLDDLTALNLIAWTSLIIPGSGSDPLRIVELAERVVSMKPQTHEYLNTLGAAYYRAGRFTEATAQFQRSIEAHETKQGMCIDWLFLAMAHARLGEHEQARSWLDKAISAPEPATWQDRLEQRLLRHEAQQIVQAATRAGQ